MIRAIHGKMRYLFIVFVFISKASYAGIIHVPYDYMTIQEGINVAYNGDVIQVADGTYFSQYNIDFLGKAITVESASGAVTCVLDGQNIGRNGSTFYFHSNETQFSVLRGFTIRNYIKTSGDGGAILCDNASPTLTNLTITANSTSGANSRGAGIALYGTASPILSNSMLSYN